MDVTQQVAPAWRGRLICNYSVDVTRAASENKSVYCVYTRNLGANLWLLLGAKSMPFGCMSMARLGAKYAVVGCKVYGDFWVHVCAFWVHVYGSVGCMPDCR